MDKFPLVSVICPAFNAATTLNECIGSVTKQTYQNIEIIIVDDGSEDNTKKVAYDISRNDERVRIISQANSGSCVARNTGFSQSKGVYVSVIDADDMWPKYKIEEQVSLLQKNSNSIVIGGVKRFGIENERHIWYREKYPFIYKGKDKYLNKLIQMGNHEMVLINTLCAKREFILSDGWDPQIKTGHDWELWIRLAKKYPFITSNRIYQFYRKSKVSATQKNPIKKVVDSHIMVTERHGYDILRSHSQVKKLISKRLMVLAQAAYLRGDISSMLYCYRKSCKYRYGFLQKDFYKLLIKGFLKRQQFLSK